MAKKNQEQLDKLQDAVTRFKKIMTQEPGDNKIFSQELDSVILRLLNKMHEVISQKFSGPPKGQRTKPGISEPKGASATIKVSEKDGKPK